MELRNYLNILRRRILLIGLTVLAGLVAAWLGTNRTTHYTAETTIYIGASRFSFDTGAGADLSGDRAVGLERILATYADMISSQPVAQAAIEITGIQRGAALLAAQTNAFAKPGTNLLAVRVTDGNPVTAQQLSVAMAEGFIKKLNEIEPGQTVGEGNLPSIPASIFERAQLPTRPSGTSLTKNLVVAALFGLVLSSGLILLAEYLDVTVKSAEDAERRLELPVLGGIPLQRQGLPVPAQLRARGSLSTRAERSA